MENPNCSHNTVKTAKKEFSNLDDLLNYIQNDQPKKKSNKKKKARQKLNKKSKEKEDSKENYDIDESVLTKFKEILHDNSVNANLFPKIKPNLSEDWINSLRNLYISMK